MNLPPELHKALLDTQLITRYEITEDVFYTLERYVNDKIPTGGFLEAVLSNDLKEACMRADDVNQKIIFNIVKYIYNELPAICWGSPQRVNRWLSNSDEDY